MPPFQFQIVARCGVGALANLAIDGVDHAGVRDAGLFRTVVSSLAKPQRAGGHLVGSTYNAGTINATVSGTRQPSFERRVSKRI